MKKTVFILVIFYLLVPHGSVFAQEEAAGVEPPEEAAVKEKAEEVKETTPEEKPEPEAKGEQEEAPQETAEEGKVEAEAKVEKNESPVEVVAEEETVVPAEEDVAKEAEPEEEAPDTEVADVKGGSRGNWQEKRDWLIKAKDENNKVQDLADDVLKLRDDFWEKFKKVQEELDQFYEEIGGGRARINELKKDYDELAEQTKNLEVSLIEEREIREIADKKAKPFYVKFLDFTEYIIISMKDVVLDVWDYMRGFFVEIKSRKKKFHSKLKLEEIFDEEAYAEKTAKLKKEIELLDSSIKSVHEVDDALVKRMDKLDEQIKMGVEQSDKTRDLYNDIWDMIDHNKAKENVFQIKSIKKKIQSIQEFLKGEFLTDFEATIATAKKQKEKVLGELGALEKNLKEFAGGEVELVQVEKKPAEVKKEEPEKKPASEKAEKPSTEKSLYDKSLDAMYNFGVAIWQGIESFSGKVIDWFSGTVESITGFVESKLSKKTPEVVEVESAEALQPEEKEESVEKSG